MMATTRLQTPVRCLEDSDLPTPCELHPLGDRALRHVGTANSRGLFHPLRVDPEVVEPPHVPTIDRGSPADRFVLSRSNIEVLLPKACRREVAYLVATGSNGFGLLEPFSGLVHLPPVAAGSDR